MDAARALARLPGSFDRDPLPARQKPYLRLPNHTGVEPAIRDAAYRNLLPAGAATARGSEFKNKLLRRYAHAALVQRAQHEAEFFAPRGRSTAMI